MIHDIAAAPLTFSEAQRRFLGKEDTPIAYLDHCIAAIESQEAVVRAWASTRFDGARKDAQESAQRYRAGAPLSLIDGMPIGIKDLISTRDLPTGLGIAGHSPMTGDDSATIQALRAAGAIILGKVTTTELGGGTPSVTTNPFDPARTPGGSSSGSAAAVAAGMIPVALGTQVGGSILRPAAFCGNMALKPTMGAFHRGERLGLSHACIGVHANSFEDLWTASVEIATRSGGDPGYPGLFGALPLPASKPLRRVGVLEGPGWDATDPGAQALFNALLARIETAGVVIIRPGAESRFDAFHDMVADAYRMVGLIVAWENRPLLANLMARIPDKLSGPTLAQYEYGSKLSVVDYRDALEKRNLFRQKHAELADVCDAVISLAAPGIAPLIDDPDRAPGQMATGNPIYNIVPSLLGAPALSLPMLSMQGMPLGVQVIGQWHADQSLIAQGRWLMDTFVP
ncbi:amidase [Sphingobium sp. TA15]|uniref:Putative amidase n=1 Tax=Sphingobium indicum (strain DSM 16413 / CCM 7287 / MTCC 6362 / UT26 / NBRC 101211 / UT26S) TaxID=452662 RepID=D4Z284_SPHIU|nr:amidase [Sphingobium indicum]BAI96716.1 putative amidase [Sphingobium indicum UT26S]BDD66151.1 amidase [Sphingobium sp. TA15]